MLVAVMGRVLDLTQDARDLPIAVWVVNANTYPPICR